LWRTLTVSCAPARLRPSAAAPLLSHRATVTAKISEQRRSAAKERRKSSSRVEATATAAAEAEAAIRCVG
jgi:hypothetical protein